MTRWIANQFRTFRKIYHWWRDQLTIVGIVVFLVMIGAIPKLVDPGAVLAIVFIACSTMLLVTSGVSYLYRPRLAVRATCPPKWMQSECGTVLVEITNQSRRPVYDLQLELTPVPETWEIVQSRRFVKMLGSGQTIMLSCSVKALRRGLFQLPHLRAITFFPLQLVRRSETIPLPRKALILPFYRPLRSFDLAPSAPSLAYGSVLALQMVGLTGEYVGSREYQPGVPVRKWDYPSWARLGQPVVREFSEPRHSSAAVILDTFLPEEGVDNEQLVPEIETTLSLAAAITEALIERGDRVALLAVGDRVFARRDRASEQHQLAILERLALAQPSSADKVSDLAQEIEQTPVTWDLAIVVSHRWDAEQEHLFATVTGKYVSGKRVLVHADGPASSNAPHRLLQHVTSSQVEAGLVDL